MNGATVSSGSVWPTAADYTSEITSKLDRYLKFRSTIPGIAAQFTLSERVSRSAVAGKLVGMRACVRARLSSCVPATLATTTVCEVRPSNQTHRIWHPNEICISIIYRTRAGVKGFMDELPILVAFANRALGGRGDERELGGRNFYMLTRSLLSRERAVNKKSGCCCCCCGCSTTTRLARIGRLPPERLCRPGTILG